MTTVANDGPERRTRVAAYAWVEHEGSVLLCLNAPDLPNGDKWSLPGGGVDWGEHPEEALHRELHEETSLAGTITGFLGIDSVVREHPTLDVDSPLHALRVVYCMSASGEPSVLEVGGTTVAAAWHPIEQLDALPLVELVSWARNQVRS